MLANQGQKEDFCVVLGVESQCKSPKFSPKQKIQQIVVVSRSMQQQKRTKDVSGHVSSLSFSYWLEIFSLSFHYLNFLLLLNNMMTFFSFVCSFLLLMIKELDPALGPQFQILRKLSQDPVQTAIPSSVTPRQETLLS